MHEYPHTKKKVSRDHSSPTPSTLKTHVAVARRVDGARRTEDDLATAVTGAGSRLARRAVGHGRGPCRHGERARRTLDAGRRPLPGRVRPRGTVLARIKRGVRAEKSRTTPDGGDQHDC